jgi:phosphate transport system protein
MERAIDHDLEIIAKHLKEMATKVEFMLEQSMKALSERNSQLAQDIIGLDKDVDQLELAIDEEVLRMLALRQPAASDLRVAIAAIKINTDLERMGDYCEAICRQVIVLNNYPALKELEKTPELARRVREMLRGAVESYTNNDVERAKSVIMSDDQADAVYREITKDLIARMKRDSSLVEVCSAAMLVNSRLERIADQATNICEEVIFTVTGDSVKHRKRSVMWGQKKG